MQCSGMLVNTGFFPHSSLYSFSCIFMLGLILQPDDITQVSNIIYSSGTA